MRLPFDRFLNLVYYFATEDADPKERDRFDMRLHLPTRRARERGAATAEGSPWSKRAEEQALAGFVAQLKGASS